jgi:ribonucleoside-diphosphate reductase alpha chain
VSISANGNGHAPKADAQLVGQTVQPALVAPAPTKSVAIFDLCPECGNSTLAHEEGCKKCYTCGYSAC